MIAILCDDALMLHELHERTSYILGGLIDPDVSLPAKMTGEIGFVLVLAALVFGLIFLSRARAPGSVGRAHADILILLFVALGIVGVALDQVHAVLKPSMVRV